MKLSIIIPVYNAENHLNQCIDTILTQKFTEFELILINDSSTDCSGDICEVYAANDKRVKVFHKSNGGVSSARNLGVENASGEWITFIDADDYISANYFEILKSETDVDIILQGLTYVEDSNVIKHIVYQAEKLLLEEFMLKYTVYPYFSSSWAKFFKLDIVRKHTIKFDEQITYGEDTLFNLNYLFFCRLITTSCFSGYCYRVSNSGLTNSAYNFQHDLTFYRAFMKLHSQYLHSSFFKDALEIPLTRLSKGMYNDESVQRAERRKILRDIVENHFEMLLRIYTDPKIKAFFVAAYYAGTYFLLDFVLLNLARKSK